MIVRCPQCELIRTVPDNKIPPTAQLATCPRCKHRFRFRILEPRPEFPQEKSPLTPEADPAPSPVRDDIWEAMDVLHKKWEQKSDSKSAQVPETGRTIQHAPTTANEQIDKTAQDPAVPEPTPSVQTSEPATSDNSLSHIKLDATQHSLFDCMAPVAPCEQAHQNNGIPNRTGESLAGETTQAFASQCRDTGNAENNGEPFAVDYTILTEENDPARTNTIDCACLAESPHGMTDTGINKDYPKDDDGCSSAFDETDPASSKNPATPEYEENTSAPAEIFTTASLKLEAQVVQPFFYRNDNLTVEEKVSNDIQLMESAEKVPVRDLGPLDDHFRKLEEQIQAEEERNASIPWEQPKRHGLAGSFLRTLFMMLFTPAYSFSRLSSSGSLAPAYLFLLVLGYVLILSTACWSYALTLLLSPEGTLHTPPIDLPSILLLAPVLLGIGLLAVSGCTMLLLRLFTRNEANLLLVCRIFCYASAPYALSVIPFVGTIAATGWFCYILTVAFHNRLQTSWLQSLLIPVPPALLLLGLVTIFFLV